MRLLESNICMLIKEKNKKWLIIKKKNIKKVLTDGKFDDKIISAVAETGSCLDGEQNQ